MLSVSRGARFSCHGEPAKLLDERKRQREEKDEGEPLGQLHVGERDGRGGDGGAGAVNRVKRLDVTRTLAQHVHVREVLLLEEGEQRALEVPHRQHHELRPRALVLLDLEYTRTRTVRNKGKSGASKSQACMCVYARAKCDPPQSQPPPSPRPT